MHEWKGETATAATHREFAQLLEIVMCERDWQLYYEGLILADHHGDAFDRNLATERPEQARRS